MDFSAHKVDFNALHMDLKEPYLILLSSLIICNLDQRVLFRDSKTFVVNCFMLFEVKYRKM